MNYHKIEKFSTSNGNGIRVVFWCSGCNHCCRNCQNPETWDEHSGQPVTIDTYREIAKALNHSYISGITWSGGDPLFEKNRDELENLIEFVNDNFQVTQWLYTGYCWDEIKHLNLMKYIDVVVEGPYVDELRDISLKWRGSSNQRVIDVKKSLQTGEIVLWCD